MASGGAIGSGFFDLWARFYDIPIVQAIAYRPVHDAVLEVISSSAPDRVLDVGCGTGLLAERLVRATGQPVVGVDFSLGMLTEASERSQAVDWTQGDAMCLPFASGSFDVITCTESFHWYPDQPGAMREFNRVLTPGGRVLVALMSPPLDSLPFIDRLPVPHLRRARWPSPRQLRSLFNDATLNVAEQRRIERVPGLPIMSALLTIGQKPAS